MNRNNQKQVQNDATDSMPIIRDCRDLPVLCSRCRSLLAFVDADTKTTIRVKNRDLYIYVVDAQEFTISCRSCGSMNSVFRMEN